MVTANRWCHDSCLQTRSFLLPSVDTRTTELADRKPNRRSFQQFKMHIYRQPQRLPSNKAEFCDMQVAKVTAVCIAFFRHAKSDMGLRIRKGSRRCPEVQCYKQVRLHIATCALHT